MLTWGEVKRPAVGSKDQKNGLMISFLAQTARRISEMLSVEFRAIERLDGHCKIKLVGKGKKVRVVMAVQQDRGHNPH